MRSRSIDEYLDNVSERSELHDYIVDLKKKNEEKHYDYFFLLIDIDKFKMINNALGYHQGDRILVETIKRIAHISGPHATIFRMGSDEFLIVKKIENTMNAKVFTQNILDMIMKPIILWNCRLCISASAGLCHFPRDGTSMDVLLRKLEFSLGQAKAIGSNSIHLYSKNIYSDLIQTAKLRYELYMDIGNAIDNNELEIHYQPIISFSTNTITGFEALIRWRHKKIGLVSPADFIPLAEENGNIIPIGDWVLRKATKQCKVWQEMIKRKLIISINLSARQLLDPELCAKVKSAMEEAKLEPDSLELEITETSLIKDIGRAGRVLDSLRKMEINISIDDFGTGYSSLNYVTHFNVSRIKIDKSYISLIPTSQKVKTISKAIINTAHEIGREVIAEGIESKTEYSLLKSLNCDSYQGYYFSRPLPTEKICDLLLGYT